jgi:hypothetical protein
MTDGFIVTTDSLSITVETESFTVVFSKEHCGITSFKYKTGSTWHECVEPGIASPILLGPYLYCDGITGDYLYPSGGYQNSVVVETPWFISINQDGYLRNSSIPGFTDLDYRVQWNVWPSGRIACNMTLTNNYGSTLVLDEDAYRMDPADDPDINLDRDAHTYLYWFGFYSNNTGSGANDLSADGITVSYRSRLTNYGTSGNTNRIYRTSFLWDDRTGIDQEFLLALSLYGSWGDCTNSTDIQNRGDSLSDDLLHPDPLDGSTNAGDMITGSLVGSGFDNKLSAYVVSV